MKNSIVFIVDDNKAACESLQWVLNLIDIPTKIFLSAEEFLSACHASMLGCLLLDMQLPHMDGTALLHELHNRHLQLPVIIVSGQKDIPATVHSIYKPIVGVFKKPVDADKLLTVIQQVIHQSSTTS